MISKESIHPHTRGRVYQIPESIDEAEMLLNAPWNRDTPPGQQAVVLSWLLKHVGDNDKAYRLYMAHQVFLDARWMRKR